MDRNIQLLIAYDGTDFHGWQRQTDLRTVQQEIETVLMRVVRHPVALVASGRTDAGVHAAGQVASFHTEAEMPAEKIRAALLSRLPDDLTVIRARDVPISFHANRDAKSKLYRYRIYNVRRRPVGSLVQRFVSHYHQPLDIDLMQQAARCFLGEYDFQAFTPTSGAERQSYVRTILRCEVYTANEEIRIDAIGAGFLYNQVRIMVGTLIEVGRERWPPGYVSEILESRDRQNAGFTAQPWGLCLQWVEYPPDREIAERSKPADESDRIEDVSPAPEQDAP